jgi:hypothetical protein
MSVRASVGVAAIFACTFAVSSAIAFGCDTSTLWQRLISTPAEPARFDRALRVGPDLLSP